MNNFLPIEKYKEILDITPVCTVDVLFFNDDKTKILLFKRENEPLKGVYFSVGGRLFKNERLIDCAVRQALREVGLTVNKEELTLGGVQEEINPNSIFDNISYHAVDIFYGCVIKEGMVLKLDSQHSDYQWFSVHDDTLHPFLKIIIKKMLKIYGKGL